MVTAILVRMKLFDMTITRFNCIWKHILLLKSIFSAYCKNRSENCKSMVGYHDDKFLPNKYPNVEYNFRMTKNIWNSLYLICSICSIIS